LYNQILGSIENVVFNTKLTYFVFLTNVSMTLVSMNLHNIQLPLKKKHNAYNFFFDTIMHIT